MRKLKTLLAHTPLFKIGDFILLQEYIYDFENKRFNVGEPVLVMFVRHFVADQTIGFDAIKWTKDFSNHEIEQFSFIEWHDYIDILGHWPKRPTFRELKAAFMTRNNNAFGTYDDINVNYNM